MYFCKSSNTLENTASWMPLNLISQCPLSCHCVRGKHKWLRVGIEKGCVLPEAKSASNYLLSKASSTGNLWLKLKVTNQDMQVASRAWEWPLVSKETGTSVLHHKELNSAATWMGRDTDSSLKHPERNIALPIAWSLAWWDPYQLLTRGTLRL